MSNVDLIFTNHTAEEISANLLTLPTSTPSIDVSTNILVEMNATSANASVLKNVFYFQTDAQIAEQGLDLSGVEIDDTKFYVDTSKWATMATDINPSHRIDNLDRTDGGDGKAKDLGVFVADEDIARNFLRSIATDMFGTHLGVDLFTNETSVRQNIEDSLKAKGLEIVSVMAEVGVSGDDSDLKGDAGYKYLPEDVTGTKNVSRELFTQLMAAQPTRFGAGESGLRAYRHATLNVPYNADPATPGYLGTGYYSIPFVSNDTISYKVTINPAVDQDSNVNVGGTAKARSYRIRLKIA